MRDRRVAADLPAVARARALVEGVLRAVDRSDRVEHRQRRLAARPKCYLDLGQARPRVPLKQDVREVPPLRALPDQGDLARALHGQPILDKRRDLLRRPARQLGQRRSAVPENPGIAVLVCAQGFPGETHGVEELAQRFHRMHIRRVFRVVGDVTGERVRLCMLTLEAGDEQPGFTLGSQDECHRTLRRHECEPDVVQDVGRLEQDHPRQPHLAKVRRQRGCPPFVFGLLNRERHAARSLSRQSGSSSRRRLMRSPTGGCVTKSAPSPSSMNGLIV
jgi:hypothetical protein